MMGINVKRRLYEGIVVPTALYVAETWSIAVAEKKRLNVMEMRCLRNMCRVTCMKKEEVRKRTGVMRDFASRAEQSVLWWFGYMDRIEEDWLVKRKVRSNVKSVRLRGRPQTGWIDGVKRVLHEIGMSVEQSRMIVCDRSEWRAVVK